MQRKMGANIHQFPEGTPPYLKIFEIYEGGIIHVYNESVATTSPGEAIQVGDRIIKVDGKGGTVQELIEHMIDVLKG